MTRFNPETSKHWPMIRALAVTLAINPGMIAGDESSSIFSPEANARGLLTDTIWRASRRNRSRLVQAAFRVYQETRDAHRPA